MVAEVENRICASTLGDTIHFTSERFATQNVDAGRGRRMRDTCAGGGAYARCTPARGRPQESSVAPRIAKIVEAGEQRRREQPAACSARRPPPSPRRGADVGRRCDGRGAE